MNVMQQLQAEWDRAALVSPDPLPDPRPTWGRAALAAALLYALAIVALFVIVAFAPALHG
jgi:hypothetical protein